MEYLNISLLSIKLKLLEISMYLVITCFTGVSKFSCSLIALLFFPTSYRDQMGAPT